MRELDRLNVIFEVCLYLLVLLPTVMIGLGGSLGLALGAIFAVSVPLSWVANRRGWSSPRHAIGWNLVMLAFLVVTVAQVLFADLSALDGGIRFVVVLTVIRLFSRPTERDELQLITLSFLGVAAATTVNEDVTFGLLFGAYVLLGTFTLAVFHLRSELRARPRLALAERQPSLTGGYFGVLMVMGGFILAVSVGIFFTFPRIGLGFFAPQERDGVSMAGFSDNVELGGHGRIRDNPQVVMRVEFPDGEFDEMSNIHWRVMTFDQYDGRSWSRTLPDRGRGLPIDDGVSDLSRVFDSTGPSQTLEIYLEPLGTDLLPVIRPSHGLRLGTTDFVMRWGPRAGHVRRDAYDDIHHTIESELGIAYMLTLSEGRELRPDRRTPRREFLQLPELTPRVRELAATITRDAVTNREKADAVHEAMRQYDYTTDLPPVGDDPIDAFLFETRRGHCEYFATATVLLLREAGVPTRLVNGFLGGRWNNVGEYLAVRQGDAHSWAEYWDPDRGWTQLDTTPATDRLDQQSLTELARAVFDSMRLRWVKWVIEYDLNAQIDAFRKLAAVLMSADAASTPSTSRRPMAMKTESTGNWRDALLIGGLATLLFAAFHRTRRRRRRRDSGAATTTTVIFYVGAGALWAGWFIGTATPNLAFGAIFPAVGVVAAFVDHRLANPPTVGELLAIIEHAAARKQLLRRPDEGPQQFLHRVAAAFPAVAAQIDRFAPRYLRARFGGDADREELDRLRGAAHRIADQLRKS